MALLGNCPSCWSLLRKCEVSFMKFYGLYDVRGVSLKMLFLLG